MRQAVVWSKNKNKFNQNDKVYLVNQTLMFGNLSEIKELIKKYGKKEIIDIFLKKPLQIYTRPAVNFIQKIILDIKDQIDYQRYVKNLY